MRICFDKVALKEGLLPRGFSRCFGPECCRIVSHLSAPFGISTKSRHGGLGSPGPPFFFFLNSSRVIESLVCLPILSINPSAAFAHLTSILRSPGLQSGLPSWSPYFYSSFSIFWGWFSLFGPYQSAISSVNASCHCAHRELTDLLILRFKSGANSQSCLVIAKSWHQNRTDQMLRM